MRLIAMSVLLVFALPGQAELYKCVDARGKTHYSDQPMADCRAARTIKEPAPRAAPAPAPAAAKAKPGAPAKDALGATNPEATPPQQLAARCKTRREEQEWLNSAAGKAAPFHTERVAQVEQALRECR
jgi:hypothetical protein